jgi:hypothetical protein
VPVIELVVGMFSPGEKPKVRQGLKELDNLLGIDVRQDLIGSLGPRFVHYTSPSEGILSFGEVFLFQVKDQEKLQATLDQAIKGLAGSTGANLKIRKRKYRGIEVREVVWKTQAMFFLPTYAIHNGWLAVSYYPQPVHGYLLRATGELKKWQPGPAVKRSLDKLPKEFIAVSISDPRPTIKQLLTIAPLVVQIINQNLPEFNLDVGAMPNAAEATRYLFPNVSVVSDDGNVLRSETRSSLSLPLEVSGLDGYGVFFAFIGIAQFVFG